MQLEKGKAYRIKVTDDETKYLYVFDSEKSQVHALYARCTEDLGLYNFTQVWISAESLEKAEEITLQEFTSCVKWSLAFAIDEAENSFIYKKF